MKSFLLGVIVGAGLSIWGVMSLQKKENRARVEDVREGFTNKAERIKEAIQEKLDPEEIKKELERTSTIVREKVRKVGSSFADTAADARVTAAVKSKLASESALSVFSIHVETSDGLVTLSGVVNSHDEIAKAVELAMSVDGVRKVISTMQVKEREKDQ